MSSPIDPPIGPPPGGELPPPEDPPFTLLSDPLPNFESNLSQADKDKNVDAFLNKFLPGFPQLEFPRITIVEFVRAIADNLLEMIVATKEADLQSLKSLIASQFEVGSALLGTLTKLEDFAAEHQEQAGRMGQTQTEIGDKEGEVQQAQTDYNTAQQNYINDPTQANADALNEAALELNTLIDEYNDLVARYNEALSLINGQRGSLSIPPLRYADNPPGTPGPEVLFLPPIDEANKITEIYVPDPPGSPPQSTFIIASVFLIPNVGLSNDIDPQFYIETGVVAQLSQFDPKAAARLAEFLKSIGVEELLSIFFLSRGRASMEVKTAENYGALVAQSSAQGATLSSVALGLGGLNVDSLLAGANLANVVNDTNFNISIGSQSLKTAVQNAVVRGGAAGALSSVRFALAEVGQRLKGIDPDSDVVKIATETALVQNLQKVFTSPEFNAAIALNIASEPAFAGLALQDQQTLAGLTAALASTAVLSEGGYALALRSEQPDLVLGTLALNLTFGLQGTQLGLREMIKSLRETLGTNTSELSDAFTDVLLASGLSSEQAREIAIRLATGLLTAEDPLAFLREILKGVLPSEKTIEQLVATIILAAFTHDVSVNALRTKEDEIERIRKDLEWGGHDPKLADQFREISNGEGSALQILNKEVATLGPEATETAFNSLLSVRLEGSLIEKLSGEVGKSEAQIMAKEAISLLNSFYVQMADLVKRLQELGNASGIYSGAQFILKPWRKGQDPAAFLSKLAEIPQGAAMFSIYLEGLKSPSVNMKTGIPIDESGSGYMQISA